MYVMRHLCCQSFMFFFALQDSGVGLDLPSKSQDGFKFPIAPAPRRHRVFSDDAVNSPLKYSPVKESPTFKGKLLSLLSPSPSPKRSSHVSIFPIVRTSIFCSFISKECYNGFFFFFVENKSSEAKKVFTDMQSCRRWRRRRILGVERYWQWWTRKWCSIRSRQTDQCSST